MEENIIFLEYNDFFLAKHLSTPSRPPGAEDVGEGYFFPAAHFSSLSSILRNFHLLFVFVT